MAIDRYKGKQAASNYLASKLRNQPSLQGMNKLLEYKISTDSDTDRSIFSDMKNAVEKMQKDQTDYQCRHCGFQSNTLYWLCPSCKSWSQVKPSLYEKL